MHHPHCHSSQRRLLVVEDHLDTLQMMVRLLTREGFAVTPATSAAGAKNCIATARFDLLLTDVGLPDGSGLDVLAEWKRRGLGPAIAITGYGMPEEIDRVLRAGAAAHFVKPVPFSTISDAVTKALSTANPCLSPVAAA